MYLTPLERCECPLHSPFLWTDYDDETLTANRQSNSDDLDRLVMLANHYSDIVFSVSVGNEASVS